MTDRQALEARIVDAALKLAAMRPWSEVSLLDIAAEAGVTLADMRGVLGSKGEIVAVFARRIDDGILARTGRPPAGQSARDSLFEVVMNRFDALAPYKASLKSMHEGGVLDPVGLRALLSSQAWMLAAAGVETEGVAGGLKVAGLATVYASLFRTWLDDDDPGLARTMAALDRRLRRGERTLATMDECAGALKRVGDLFRPGRRAAKPSSGGEAPPSDPLAPTPAS